MNPQMDLFTSKPYNDHAGFAHGSSTSLQAAVKATRTRTSVQRDVLVCYESIGPMTADSCARLLGMHFMYVRPRCTELVMEGYLAIDKTLEGVSELGNPQAVLVRTRKVRTGDLA